MVACEKAGFAWPARGGLWIDILAALTTTLGFFFGGCGLRDTPSEPVSLSPID